jgi:curved DNA-binding protein CbpA
LTTPAKLDYYEALNVRSTATQQEIERAYTRRAGELRASKIEDVPEELAEVEEAHSVLADPGKRARYDAEVQESEAKEDKKNAELDAYLKHAGRRRPARNRRSGGWLDALLDILSFFK